LETLNQYKILIVDDRKENLVSLSAVLKNAGYLNDSSLSGKEALHMLLKNKYGLIILDVQMPEINGFELAEMIKGSNLTKDIPLIFLSANATQSEYNKKGHEAGALDYLAKPVDETLLLLKVKNLLQLHHSNIMLEKANRMLKNKVVQATISYQNLYYSLPQDIFLINKEGIIININKKDILLCGVEANKLINMHYTKSVLLTKILGKQELNKIFIQLIEHSDGNKIEEYDILREDKTVFYAGVTLTLAVIDDNINIQVSVIDITQRKEIENELHKSESKIQNFANYLNGAMEDQRTNLAREIHDELGQQLAGIKFGISSLKKIMVTNLEAKNKITDVLIDVDNTIQNLRKIATKLRPGILDTLGLAASIDWLAKEFQKRTNINCIIELDVNDQIFDNNISTCFFRICQEALSNIAKHAEASEIKIHLYIEESKLILNIKDNGIGILAKKKDNPFSMGLLGMNERAKLIGGTLEILSEQGKGTLIKTFVNLK
jgi:PAS domain S-box-containing protein